MLPAVASTIVSPGPQHAARLGVDHDGQRDAVLDAAARIQVLALGEDRHLEAGRDRPERHERRVADVTEDARLARAGQALAPS